MATVLPGMRPSVPSSKVELRIRCAHLLDRDVTSKSDPCAVMFMQEANGRWYEVGRTENIKNCLDPQFTRAFEVDYYFEEVQKLRFAVYDLDNKTPDLSDDDFLGEMECTMGQVVSGSPYTQKLMMRSGPAGKGTMTILSEEVSGLNDVLIMKFSAQGLDKKDTFGKSDPYLEFSRTMPDGSWQPVHRTEVIKNTLNPTWREFEIPARKLCGIDVNKPVRMAVYDHDDSSDPDLIGSTQTSVAQLKSAAPDGTQVDCYDYDNDGGHDLIGSFSTSVAGLMDSATSHQKLQWPAINPKKKAKKKNYKDSGVIYLNSIRLTKEYSFLDFIYGGLQINFTVGIDFTASNGDPRTPQSLHYINAHVPNEYQKAIQSVGAVIQDYDVDKMFPVLGFGARIPPSYDISHEFPCNFDNQNPFCAGVPGILQVYQTCVAQVQLYGPTNFAPIIHHVARFGAAAQAEVGAKSYYVLLIVTDGVISDFPDTLGAIVYASTLPMSIIIVGVGRADFSAMDALDGDDGVLRDGFGNKARRDIVQFVPFRKFVKSYYVLLILTDGVISDMPATRDAIVYASTLPMSLIIVGVGNADFTAMNVLDGDDGVLKGTRGNPVRRDIVQFVPYREFVRAPLATLAKHVLAEVPKQVTDYFRMQGIPPNPRPQAQAQAQAPPPQ